MYGTHGKLKNCEYVPLDEKLYSKTEGLLGLGVNSKVPEYIEPGNKYLKVKGVALGGDVNGFLNSVSNDNK